MRVSCSGVKIEGTSAAGINQTRVSYYVASDADDARKLAATLQSLGVPAPDPQPKLVPAPNDARPRHFDVVVAQGALRPGPTAD